MEMEDVVFMCIGIGLAATIAFNLGETSGKKAICSQFKEHVLTTDGKCIKVEQDTTKEHNNGI